LEAYLGKESEMKKRISGAVVFLLGMLWGSSAFATASATIREGLHNAVKVQLDGA
jgi:hypothetical protein